MNNPARRAPTLWCVPTRRRRTHLGCRVVERVACARHEATGEPMLWHHVELSCDRPVIIEDRRSTKKPAVGA